MVIDTKYNRIEILETDKVKVHQLALLTPNMTDEQFTALKNSIAELGQLEPVILYHGKIIDGRHRLKALKELKIKTIKAKRIDPKLSLDDVKNLILKGYELRRHQTPTQRAIGAYMVYKEMKELGKKTSMEEIAKTYGTNRKMLTRVKKLEELAGSRLIDALYDGKKIKLPDTNKTTDSLQALIQYYTKLDADRVVPIENKHDLTDDEEIVVNDLFEDVITKCNKLQLKKLTDMLYSYQQQAEIEKTEITTSNNKEIYELDVLDSQQPSIKIPLTRLKIHKDLS